jgi:ribosomal protein S18 acetylase RimI-like enzyme
MTPTGFEYADRDFVLKTDYLGRAVKLVSSPMALEPSSYSTRELSSRTWRDFEKLFGKKSKWGGCWCMIFQRPGPLPKSETRKLTKEQRVGRDRKDKKELVERGRSHGILVYSDEEPVGWCQYGLKRELPRIDAGRIYTKLTLDNEEGKRLWRITCFWVDRNYRGRGVATASLKAALKSIKKKGGGLVEAYPAIRKGFPADWFGTVSMFKKEGFKFVAPFGKSNVLVRKTIIQ